MTHLLTNNWSQYEDHVFQVSVCICDKILEEEVLVCGIDVIPAYHPVAIYFYLVR